MPVLTRQRLQGTRPVKHMYTHGVHSRLCRMMRPTQNKKASGNDDPCIDLEIWMFSFPAVVRSCTRRKRDLQEAGVPYLVHRAMQMLMLCLSGCVSGVFRSCTVCRASDFSTATFKAFWVYMFGVGGIGILWIRGTPYANWGGCRQLRLYLIFHITYEYIIL